MRQSFVVAWFAAAMAGGLLALGCGGEAEAPKPATPVSPAAGAPAGADPATDAAPAEEPVGEAPAAETGADVDVLDPEIEKNLANLSAEDRAAVLKQRVCPVTKEPLGSMGAPIKIEGPDGHALFICCEGCKEKTESNFAEYWKEFGAAAE